MAYCDATDLLLGDLTTTGVDLQAYIDSAAEEIDGRLGYVYDLDDVHALDPNTPGYLILKKINRFIASGRIVMAQTVGGEDDNLQAYGASLVRLAYGDLALILNKELPLEAESVGEITGRQPTILVRDAFSGMEAFEDAFMTGIGGVGERLPISGPVWQPGGGNA